MPEVVNRSRWLLAVVLAGGVLLAAALTAGIAWRHGSFEKTAPLYAITDNAGSIAAGTAVRLSGVRIGEVTQLTLLPNLKVKIDMRVDADLLPSLRADARAQLVREQLRPAVIDIEPGVASAPLDAQDPRLSFRSRATLTEIADELRGRLVPILDDLKQVSGTLRARQDDIASVLQHAATASGELARAATEVQLLVAGTRTQLTGIGNQSQGLLTQGTAAVTRVGGLVEQVNTSLGVVNGALPGLLNKADRTLDSLQGVATDLRQISTAAATTLPGVLLATPPMVDDAQELVQGARRSWLVRGLLSPPAAAELPISSHDAAVLRNAPPR